MDAFEHQALLKQKIRAREPVLGLFVKTPSMHIVEVLTNADFDFIVLDAEHAPFSTDSLDQCLLAARANNLPALVRVADGSSSEILTALDLGAAGILVPHIKSTELANKALAATRYRDGERGFSASHRAGGYAAMSVSDYIAASDQNTVVIGQIEDVEAVDNIDEIATVTGLDALFIGPADLSVSYGLDDWNDPVIAQAIVKVCGAARKTGIAVGMFQATTDKVSQYRELGASLFTISTDQSLLSKAACQVVEDFHAACK